MQLTPKPEYSRSLTINNPPNTNEFLLRCQNFQSNQNQRGSFSESTCYDQRILTSRGFSIFKSQPENECADSPTLTTNSERSEITEASSDFNFLRGQNQFVRDQQLSSSEIHPMQQPGFNDMQLLQQHVMFKQLQEIQRQQQLQQLGDLRQQSSLNQFSAISRQAAGGQFSPLISGTPVHDASPMLRNWMQRGASPGVQGVPNKLFSQEQGQALRSTGLATQQFDVSLYGAPISNARGNMSLYPHLQGPSHDSVNLLAKASSQVQKSVMQSAGFGNPFLGDQPAVPLNLLGLSQGPLISKQELQMKDNFGQVPVQGLSSGVFPGNLLECNTPQGNTSMKEFNGRQEQAGWPARQQAKQLGPSQGLVPLDPMEAKILYNMDDNTWDTFGSRPETGTGGLGNILEQPDSSYAFPSLQSGSWSALMQSAVAEASSSDTGVQEEWSSLTFQNTEQSTDNQISNFVENEKQHTGWVDNNFQAASSFSPKPFPVITDSSMSSTFPGFQQPGIQLSVEQREDICQGGSHESIENYKPQQKTSIEDGQKVPTFVHSDNAWPGQMFEHSQRAERHQIVASSNISMEKGTESMVKSQHQMSDVPKVAFNSYEGANETQEKQNCHQRERSNDFSKGSGGHEQGHVEQLKFFGNISSSLMNLDKASLSNFQGNSRVSEEVPSGVDSVSNASTTLHGSVHPDGSNVSVQTSEHMLELLHKVDQSKDDSSTKQFGSTDGNPLTALHGADSHDRSVSQLYTQSSDSQGFGLRLAPPSQRLANSNSFPFPPGLPQTINNLNHRQVNPELGERNLSCLTPSSFQSSPASHELAQRAHWENKSDTMGPKSFSPYVNMLGNPASSFASNHPQTGNQLQMHPFSNISVSSQPLQATLPAGTGKFPSFNLAPSPDTSQQLHTNPIGQRFPVLEAAPVSQALDMSGTLLQDENSTRPYNVWRNVPTQRQSFGIEPLKFSNSASHMDWAPHGSNDQISIKAVHNSSEIGVSSSSQGFGHVEKRAGEELLQQRISAKMLDTSQPGGMSRGPEPVSDATVVTSGSLVSHAQDLDKAISTNDGADSALDVPCASALGGQQLYENVSRFRTPVDGRPNSTSQTGSFPSGHKQMLSLLGEAGDGPIVKAPQQPALQSRNSQETCNDTHSQSSSSNLHLAPSWFKQYEALRNGQMMPIFDARLAKSVASQFSLGKPSQNLHRHSSLEQLDAADAGQGGRVWPSSQQLSSPYMLPSVVNSQVAIIRPKKRKITSELLPWHKEVNQDSKRLQNISVAEQVWAKATNRLTEKVEDEFEMIDDLQPMHRSKRRLVLTTQLLQQLFHPAPASILSADSASSYDVISYFVSRLSLGDACSLAYCMRKEFLEPVNNSDVNSKKLKNSERSGEQQCLAVVEEFIDRAKKLENGFQRLDKTASVADIRAEFQELERFAVINRFAKFHVRGQIDASGTSTSSAAPKPIPQRYITGFPMPRNLPEEVQCLSL
ncbi:hypothetical protein MANES_01G095500v8 [Manihot esculenta]|nr:hypothetical protein MANES_01G095500v8 [Manihot esculenta]